MNFTFPSFNEIMTWIMIPAGDVLPIPFGGFVS